MWRCFRYPCLFLLPPLLALPFRWVGLRAFPCCLGRFPSASRWVGLLGFLLWSAACAVGFPSSFLFLWGVLVVSSSFRACSVSPLSVVAWGAPVVVSSVGGWQPAVGGRSARFSVRLSSGAVLVCVLPCGGSSPAARALVAALRAARASGAPVSLGVRSGWSPSRWFCAVAPASSRALAA